MAPPRLVLDTNVCLDLFVFDDAACAALRAALTAGEAEAVADAACRDEWLRVLDYPQLGLDASRRVAAIAAFDARLCLLADAECEPPPAAPKLPRCADPDDQKFLELAQAIGAQWLLSRDKALLKLAKRTRRDHGFDIVTPQDWSRAYTGSAGASSAKPV
jgi:predicted nucleic acid-binding protein